MDNTKKLHGFISIVVPKKNFFLFFNFIYLFSSFWGGRAVEQMWINKNTKKSNLKFDKKPCQYDDSCNNNYYFSNNSDY